MDGSINESSGDIVAERLQRTKRLERGRQCARSARYLVRASWQSSACAPCGTVFRVKRRLLRATRHSNFLGKLRILFYVAQV